MLLNTEFAPGNQPAVTGGSAYWLCSLLLTTTVVVVVGTVVEVMVMDC